MQVRILFLILLLVLGPCVSAQVDQATLTGVVSDRTAAVIPGAKVEIVSQATGFRREVTSGEAGRYTFSLLPIGVYTVTVTHAGFRTVSIKDLRPRSSSLSLQKARSQRM